MYNIYYVTLLEKLRLDEKKLKDIIILNSDKNTCVCIRYGFYLSQLVAINEFPVLHKILQGIFSMQTKAVVTYIGIELFMKVKTRQFDLCENHGEYC